MNRKEEIQKGCGKDINPRKFINKNVTCGMIGVKCGYIWIDEVRNINEICLCPTCQARLDERIIAEQDFLKMIDEQIKTMDSFYDNGYYVGNIDFIKELPEKGEMIEARIHALNLLKSTIKQETKE